MNCIHCAAKSPLIGELHKVETLDDYDAAIYFPCANLNDDKSKRLATLEEACKAVCILCAEDAPIVAVNGDDYWHDTGGTNDLCYAGSIRRLMEPEGKEWSDE